ncbi:hypothetical protein ABIG06_006411 [Bradyrhizobium sp. USDA 326]|uniref:hypothetical protein n=1 Tax=unclassified Bradyrhizobium TaxID=2631580 RepID=UPI003512039F
MARKGGTSCSFKKLISATSQPADHCVLLRNIRRGNHHLAKPIIWLDMHRIDYDGSTVTENLGAMHSYFAKYRGLSARASPDQRSAIFAFGGANNGFVLGF